MAVSWQCRALTNSKRKRKVDSGINKQREGNSSIHCNVCRILATTAPSAAPTPLTPWPMPAMHAANGPTPQAQVGQGPQPTGITPHGTPHAMGHGGTGTGGGGFDDYSGLLGMDGYGAWDSSLLMPVSGTRTVVFGGATT